MGWLLTLIGLVIVVVCLPVSIPTVALYFIATVAIGRPVNKIVKSWVRKTSKDSWPTFDGGYYYEPHDLDRARFIVSSLVGSFLGLVFGLWFIFGAKYSDGSLLWLLFWVPMGVLIVYLLSCFSDVIFEKD